MPDYRACDGDLNEAYRAWDTRSEDRPSLVFGFLEQDAILGLGEELSVLSPLDVLPSCLVSVIASAVA